MKNSELLRKNGYVIVQNVFSSQQVSQLRSDIIQYFSNGGGFANAGGRAKPDWIKDPKCKSLMWILNYDPLKRILTEFIGENYEFLHHNDIHINRVVGYHKDRLSGAGAKFEKLNPWQTINGETQQIYKVNIYLQDHSNDEHALKVKEGTHLTEKDSPNTKTISINPGLGDIVLFDQRITHRGQERHYGKPRILISLGYGVPNKFSQQFKIGTQARQDDQNTIN